MKPVSPLKLKRAELRLIDSMHVNFNDNILMRYKSMCPHQTTFKKNFFPGLPVVLSTGRWSSISV